MADKLEIEHFGRYIGRYMADISTVATFLRSRADAWTSLAQIRAAIDVPDRTLRNWLRELVTEGAVESEGERKGRRYRARDRVIVPGTGTNTFEAQAPTLAIPPLF